MFKTLKDCNFSAERLALNYNKIDDKCMEEVGEYLRTNTFIRELCLSGNKITDKGIKILAPYVIGNTTLRQLMLDENEKITNESIPLLIDTLQNTNIEIMSLQFCQITENKGIISHLAYNTLRNQNDELYLFDQ